MAVLIYLIVLLIAYLYWQHQKTYRYWRERGITSLPVLPVIGSYYDFMRQKQHVGVVAQEIYNRYYSEKYVGGFKLVDPELIVFEPDTIRRILVKDFNHFVDRGTESKSQTIIDRHLFHAKGDEWRTLRHKLTPTFTSSKMKKMFPLLLECADELRSYLKAKLRESDEHVIKELIAKFTTNTIGACAFGLNVDSLRDDNSEFREMGKTFFEPSKSVFYKKLLNTLLPFLKLQVRNNTNVLEKFFLSLVRQIMASRKTESGRHDFMDLMIELKAKGSIEMSKNDKEEYYDDTKDYRLELTDELITAQAIAFFLAGFETSSTTMNYAFGELAMNPDIQKKLHREIDTVLAQHNGKITYEAIQKMKYLDMVIDETLRKYPPIGLLQRICNSKYNLPGTDVYLDKGVRIAIPTYALHHDARHYPEPEKFDPERFTPEARSKRHPMVYIPFGEGPRICIGSRFGILQTAVGLVAVLSNYSVGTGVDFPRKFDIHPAGAAMQPLHDFKLTIKSRIQ